LTITNNEFTLTTTDGYEGIDGLETSQHRFAHTDTGNNTKRLDADTHTLAIFDRALEKQGNYVSKLKHDFQ
jgi:hypothetical protein